MQRILVLTLVFLAGLEIAFAEGPIACGSYEIAGKLKIEKNLPVLVVHSGSLSELRLHLRPPRGAKGKAMDGYLGIRAFSGIHVTAKGLLRAEPKGREAELELQSYERTDERSFREGGAEAIRLIEKKTCG